jgi:hypothetical protein
MGDNRIIAGEYELIITPPLRTITPGAKMTYQAHHRYGTLGPNRDLVQWWVANDNDIVRETGKQQFFRKHVGFVWSEYEWEKTGRFTIAAQISGGAREDTWLWYEQWVEDAETVLGSEIDRIKEEGLADPHSTYVNIVKYVWTLEEMAKKFGVPPAKQREHDELVQGYKNYYAALETSVLSHYSYHGVFPLKVLHITRETQQKNQLNVFLSKVNPATHTWKLVDWTNPLSPGMKTVFTATGASDEAAIRDLLAQWDSSNQYWPGTLSYEIPSEACGKVIEGSFETDGESFWTTLSRWLEYFALAGAIVAGVVTLVAPVPGSRIVSAAIWTSIFSSSAAAVINIGQRHEGGFGSWKDDAFDCVSVVGNLFAGAGIWAKGATVISRNASGQVLRYSLYGQVASDGIQGVMIAADTQKKMEEIEKDPNLSPKERTDKFLELFRSAALAGTMTVISIRSTKADLEVLDVKPRGQLVDPKTPRERLEDLKDPNHTVDTTAPPRTEGHTDEGGQTTRVQEENARVHGEGKSRPVKTDWPPPPAPEARGMRALDDDVFSATAQEKKLWILVRDGNASGVEYIGRKGYEGKPESMKAKTADEGPRKGLASFHPEHERTYKTLAGEAPETTVAALKADPVEFQRRYDYFLEHKIHEKGYKVDQADHCTVYKDAVDPDTGLPMKIKYHGDYDLHGVYREDGSFVSDTGGVRSELNADFGAELVRHGAHDEWPARNNPDIAGQNAGPQPPVTVYGPNGEVYHLPDRASFKRFYLDHEFGWAERYGPYEAVKGEIPVAQ